MRSGAILALTDKGVVGWAIDHDQPNSHFPVVLLGNGQPLGVKKTADADESLVKAACGEARPSFMIAVTAETVLEFPLELELRDTEGTLLSPPLTIEQPEYIDTRTLQLSTSAYEGFCDQEVGGRLEGWVWNMCVPQLPVILEVLLDGDVLHIAKADRFRDDLMDAGKRGGSCGFSVPIPLLPPGKTSSEISLRIAGTGFHLKRLTMTKDQPQAHQPARERVPALEQQLLAMGGGHPNVIFPESPSGAVSQPAIEPTMKDIEAKLREALGVQNGRLNRQEAILAAVKGTTDNLVRTWLQIRNEVALLHADLAKLQAQISGAPAATNRGMPTTVVPAKEVTTDGIDRAPTVVPVERQSAAMPSANANNPTVSRVRKQSERKRSVVDVQKRKIVPDNQRRSRT
jgi:hypothetical protein